MSERVSKENLERWCDEIARDGGRVGLLYPDTAVLDLRDCRAERDALARRVEVLENALAIVVGTLREHGHQSCSECAKAYEIGVRALAEKETSDRIRLERAVIDSAVAWTGAFADPAVSADETGKYAGAVRRAATDLIAFELRANSEEGGPVGMGWPELARSLADLHRKCDWIRWRVRRNELGNDPALDIGPEPEWPER